MRIVAGKLRGKRFDAPRNFSSRPTTDFAREALFNILQHKIDFSTSSVLDLFAGTGAFSYECFSRGVEKIVAVDADFNAVKFISGKMKEFGMLHARCMKSDALEFVSRCNEKFSLILADPPFDFTDMNEIVRAVLSSKILEADGLFILEHPPKTHFAEIASFESTRSYGNVNFSFFRNLRP